VLPHGKLAGTLDASLCLLGTARGETPFVADEWRYGRHAGESTLTFCLDKRDPDWPVAEKIGAAIAGALLLQPKQVTIEDDTVGDELDVLYQKLLDSCDLYLGFKLIADAYPDWLMVTRPYYRTSYALVTIDAHLTALADMKPDRAIAATLGTVADLRLIQYLQALPAAQRWARFPMSTDEAALKSVVAGTAGAALVWAPSLWALSRTEPTLAALKPIAPKPLPPASVDVGAALLGKETYLRSALDQAIAALLADGTIAAILAKDGFPAMPPT
jgi:polar amino acid transport system substrate-binding protein